MEGTKKKNFIVRAWNRGRAAYGALAARQYTTVAGTLVFFLIMSLVPFLFWLTLLFGNTAIGADEILELELFGWAKDLLAYIKVNAEGATTGASVLFLATTLWSSTGFFYHLRRSGEIIYGVRRPKHGWKVRLSAFVFTFLVLLFFAVAGGLLVAVSILARALPLALNYLSVYLLLLVEGFFAAWLLNAYVCPYRVAPSQTAAGSALTAGAWIVASAVFAVYFRFTDRARLYGALSLIVVFLLWLYWMMICFTAGVVYNSRRMKGKRERKKL